jgi:Xaa-Pro aminopeptidase
MNKLIISDSFKDSNLFYLTKVLVPDPFIYIRINNKSYAIVNSLEFLRIKKQAPKNLQVLPLENFIDKNKKNSLALITLKFLKQNNVNFLLVPPDFPLLYADELRKNKIKLKVKSPFINREIKTNQEINNIKKVQKIADKAMQHAISIIKNSIIKRNYLYYNNKKLTSEYLKEEIQNIFNYHDIESPEGIIASSGSQTTLPHHSGSGPIKANQPIIIDIFPRSQSTRYFCDMTRTVCKGTPSQKIKDMYNLVIKAQKAGYERIFPNSTGDSIHNAVVSTFKEFNLEKYFTHSTGHGLGIDIHESPGIPSKTKLKANMVITNEPGLYIPNLGGIRIEDTLVVTKKGYKILTKSPKQFII